MTKLRTRRSSEMQPRARINCSLGTEPAWTKHTDQTHAGAAHADGPAGLLCCDGKRHGSCVEETAGDPKHLRPPPARKQEQQPRHELKSLNLNNLYSRINETLSKRLMS